MFPSEGAPSQKSPPALNVQFIKSIPSWPEDAQDCGSTAAALQFAWSPTLQHSCPPSPLPRDSSPTPTQNKRATFRKKAVAPIDEPGVAILAKDTLPAHQLPVRCRWCKKKKEEKSLLPPASSRSRVLSLRRVRKLKTAKVLKKTSASGYFHERRRRLDGRRDGRTDGAPTEAP